MSEPFHKRFDIDVGIEEARDRFVQRIRTLAHSVLEKVRSDGHSLDPVFQRVCFELGEHYEPVIYTSAFMERWDRFVRTEFSNCLRFAEAVRTALAASGYISSAGTQFAVDVSIALNRSEADLGIDWDSEVFTKKGAKLLDDRLINDPLHWLRDARYENVLKPFEKGLKHWMEASKDPTRHGDVVTDMYEALEAIAKIVTRRDADLAGNREKFASELRLPEQYTRMLKEYIDFGCKYRHSPGVTEPREYPSEQDTEAFMYMTGLFVRRAIQPK